MLVSRDFEPADNLVTMGAFEPFWNRAESITIDVADAGVLAARRIQGTGAAHVRAALPAAVRVGRSRSVVDRLGAARWAEARVVRAALRGDVCREHAGGGPTVHPGVPRPRTTKATPTATTTDESEGVDWSALEPVLSTLAKCPLRRLALNVVRLGGLDCSKRSRRQASRRPCASSNLSDSELDDTHVAGWSRTPICSVRSKRLGLERTQVTAIVESRRSRSSARRSATSEGTGATYRYGSSASE